MIDLHGIMIVTDLDGTLLNGDGYVPEANLRAIERFKAAGGMFTIASGRYGNSVGQLFPEYRQYVNAPAIFSNGSVLFDLEKDTAISEVTGDCVELIPRMEKVKAAFPEIEITPVVMRDNVLKKQWCSELGREPYYKVLFQGETELLERARRFVDEHFAGKWKMSLSCPSLLELVIPGATKGDALDRMRAWFSERGETVRIIALGDYENDLDMLENADMAACPMNAIDSVKKAADIVLCDHNEGCIADLVDRIFDKDEFIPFIRKD